jgi:hypothetical protein
MFSFIILLPDRSPGEIPNLCSRFLTSDLDFAKRRLRHFLAVQEKAVLETGAGRDKKVLLQSHADRQADRRFMTTSSKNLMSLLSTETFKTEI